jgi:hypothetical protein
MVELEAIDWYLAQWEIRLGGAVLSITKANISVKLIHTGLLNPWIVQSSECNLALLKLH